MILRGSAVTVTTNSKKLTLLRALVQISDYELTETCLLDHNEDLIITNEDSRVEAYA